METTVNFVAVTIIYLLIGLFVAFAVWVIYRNHIKKGEKEFQQSIEEDKKLKDTSDPLVKKEGITKGKHVIVPNKIVIEVSPDKTEVDIYNFHIPNKKIFYLQFLTELHICLLMLLMFSKAIRIITFQYLLKTLQVLARH